MGKILPVWRRSFAQGLARLSLRTGPVLLASVLMSVAVFAANPFYMQLLRQGTDAYNRRDFPTAARQLRVACFGLLDEPELLADGLTRLALAQTAAGDDDGFRETFQRLTEVEERFSGYTRADIPKDVRGAFEQLVLELIPKTTLAEHPTFARLVPTRWDNVAKLPPAQRRKELARLIKAEPGELSWRLMLAKLELTEGNPRDAYAAAAGALKVFPGNKDALRLSGLALAAEEKWLQASDDLKACGTASTDPQVAGALLTSLVQLKRWQEASDLTAQLSAEVARDRTVQQLTVSAAVGLAASRPAVAPTPTRVVSGGAKVSEKPAAGAGAATGVVAGGPAQTSTPRPAAKPTAFTGALGVVAGGAPPRAATKPPEKPTVAAGSPQVSTPKPADKPATGIAAAAGSRSPRAPAQKPLTRKGVLSPAERADLDRVQELARSGMLDDAFAIARKVADARPDLVEPQFVAAEMAYRTTRWNDAVVYFRRAGDPGDRQPLLLFYSAVALYETGDRAGAAAALKRCLPNIRRTSFVDDVARKVLGDSTSVSQKP